MTIRMINGRWVDATDDAFDERGLLKDGRTARVTMAMRDAARTDEDEERRRHHVVVYDPQGRISATYEHDAAAAHAVRLADSTVKAPIGSRPGSYTSAALDQARRECVALAITDNALSRPPSDRPGHSAPLSFADAEKIRHDAYQQSVRELQDAWKGTRT